MLVKIKGAWQGNSNFYFNKKIINKNLLDGISFLKFILRVFKFFIDFSLLKRILSFKWEYKIILQIKSKPVKNYYLFIKYNFILKIYT